MKVSCDIIKDLLPLYAENLTSQASNEMVDEHLCGCDECTRQLGVLKKSQAVPVDADVKSLKRVGTTIRRRKVLTVATALLTLVTVLLTGCIYLMTPIYLTAEQAIEGVEFLEDGSAKVDYARGIVGRGKTTNGVVYVEQCETTRWDWWKAKKLDREVAAMSQDELEGYIRNLYQLTEVTQQDWNRFFNIQCQYDSQVDDEGNVQLTNIVDDRTRWYQNPNGSYTLIYGNEPEPVGRLPGYEESGYPYLFALSAGLAVALWYLARKRSGWTWELARRFAIMAASVAVATLLVTGIQLGTGVAISINSGYYWPRFISTESVFLSLTLLFWRQLYLLNRQDKAI